MFGRCTARAFTVLFVDDDHQVREPIVEALRARGLRVLSADSAIEAMRILGQESVDVPFTDIVMPDQDGLELAKQAKLIRPNIQVVFATAYFSRAASAEKLGKLLFKPLRAEEIEAVVENAASGAR